MDSNLIRNESTYLARSLKRTSDICDNRNYKYKTISNSVNDQDNITNESIAQNADDEDDEDDSFIKNQNLEAFIVNSSISSKRFKKE